MPVMGGVAPRTGSANLVVGAVTVLIFGAVSAIESRPPWRFASTVMALATCAGSFVEGAFTGQRSLVRIQ